MTVQIPQGGCDDLLVDRSGCQVDDAPQGTQGFVAHFDGCAIRFVDERDAEKLARAICLRLGVDLKYGADMSIPRPARPE